MRTGDKVILITGAIVIILLLCSSCRVTTERYSWDKNPNLMRDLTSAIDQEKADDYP